MDGDYCEIYATFEERFPNAPLPHRDMILKLHRKFQHTDGVAIAPCTGRPHSARTGENKQLVAEAFVEQPTCFAKRPSELFDFSRHSLHRVMWELKLHVTDLIYCSCYIRKTLLLHICPFVRHFL